MREFAIAKKRILSAGKSEFLLVGDECTINATSPVLDNLLA